MTRDEEPKLKAEAVKDLNRIFIEGDYAYSRSAMKPKSICTCW